MNNDLDLYVVHRISGTPIDFGPTFQLRCASSVCGILESRVVDIPTTYQHSTTTVCCPVPSNFMSRKMSPRGVPPAAFLATQIQQLGIFEAIHTRRFWLKSRRTFEDMETEDTKGMKPSKKGTFILN